MLELSFILYLIGLIVLFISIKNERITLLITWPYIIYGTGLVFSAYNYEQEIFIFTELYSYENIILSQGIMLSFILIIYFLDVLFLPKKYLLKTIQRLVNISEPLVVNIVNSNIIRVYAFLQSIILLGLLIVAFLSGEIVIGGYDYTTLSNLKYWGAIGFFTENIIIICSMYLYSFLWKDKVRRCRFLELFISFVLLIRLMSGTRLFLAKLIVFAILIYLIYKKKYIKVIIYLFMLIILLSIVAIFRLENYGELEDIKNILLSSLFAEAYFNDLTLLIATKALLISSFEYQPTAIIAFFSGLIPNFLLDRKILIENLYNHDIIVHFLGDLSPLGAMSFLAELIYATGWWYLIVIFIVGILLVCFIKSLKSSYGIFIIFALGEMSINLWRDSFVIAIKIFVVHVIINLAVIYILYYFFGKKTHLNKV